MLYVVFILVSLILLFIFYKFSNNTIVRLIGTFGLVGILFYSGLGIIMFKLDNVYLLYLFLYLFVFVISISIFSRRHLKISNYTAEKNNTSSLMIKLSGLFTLIYFLIYVLNLIYPVNRLGLIFNPPKMDIDGILNKVEERNSGIIGIFNSLQVLFIPFLYIYVFKCWKSKRKIKKFMAISLLFLNFYFNALEFEYFGRTDLVTLIIFIVFVLCYGKDGYKGQFLKVSSFLIMAAIVFLPFLFRYIYMRTGTASNVSGYFSIFEEFLKSECYYPKYYDFILNRKFAMNPFEYFKWFFTLPIPKFIIPIKTVAINGIFTQAIFNTPYITAISLPSLLGESFIVFGRYFYLLHALFLGMVIGIAARLYSKNSYLTFYAVYIGIRCLAMGRGGSQGFLSIVVNTSLLLVLIVIIDSLLKNSREVSR